MPAVNISDCLEHIKIDADLDFVFVSESNTKIICLGISSKDELKKISIASDVDSYLYVLNKSCNFETKMNDLKEENQMDTYVIGGVSCGAAFIIIIGIIIFVKQKRNIKEVKSEKAIVHQNDLYGNISNQEEHEERYDTNIVDTNQYYEDYDNIELK